MINIKTICTIIVCTAYCCILCSVLCVLFCVEVVLCSVCVCANCVRSVCGVLFCLCVQVYMFAGVLLRMCVSVYVYVCAYVCVVFGWGLWTQSDTPLYGYLCGYRVRIIKVQKNSTLIKLKTIWFSTFLLCFKIMLLLSEKVSIK